MSEAIGIDVVRYIDNPTLVESYLALRKDVFQKNYGDTIYNRTSNWDKKDNTYFIIAHENNQAKCGKRVIIAEKSSEIPMREFGVEPEKYLSEISNLKLAEQGGFCIVPGIANDKIKNEIISAVTESMMSFLKENQVDILVGIAFEKGRGFQNYCNKKDIAFIQSPLEERTESQGSIFMACSLNKAISFSRDKPIQPGGFIIN